MVGKNRKSAGLLTPNTKQVKNPDSAKKMSFGKGDENKTKQQSGKKMKGIGSSSRTPKDVHVSFQLPSKNNSPLSAKTKHPPTPMPKRKELSVLRAKGNVEFRGMNESLTKSKTQATGKGANSPMKKLLDKLNAESNDDEDDDDFDMDDDDLDDSDDSDSEDEKKNKKPKKQKAAGMKGIFQKKKSKEEESDEESDDLDSDDSDDLDSDDSDDLDSAEEEEIKNKLIALKQKKVTAQKQNECPKKSAKEIVDSTNETANAGSNKKSLQKAKSQSSVKAANKEEESDDEDEEDDDDDSEEEEEIRKKLLALKQKINAEQKALASKQAGSPKKFTKESTITNRASAVDSKKKSTQDAEAQSPVKSLGKRKAESSSEEEEDDDEEEDESDEDNEGDNKVSSSTPTQKEVQQKLKTLKQEKVTPKLSADKAAANRSLTESGKKTLKAMKLEKTTPEKKEKSSVSDAISRDQEIRRQTDARTLFIRGLPADVTEAELKALSPDITDVRFPQKKKFFRKHAQKIYAFLGFASEAKAEANFSALQNKKLRGEPLFLDFAGEKSRNSKASEAAKQPRKYDMRKLFVSGLPDDVTIAEVAALFVKATIINLNQSRTATVLFLTEEDAEEALKRNEKSKIRGKQIIVLYSLISSQDKKKKRKRKNKNAQQETTDAPPAKKAKLEPVKKGENSDDDDDDEDSDE